MAKATAICVCKHCGKEFEVSTIKMNRKLADSWEQWASTVYDCCYECEEKIRAEENARCAAEAKALGLPGLNGTQKQIAWAESIRLNIMRRMDEVFEKKLEIAQKCDGDFENREAKMVDVVRKYILENYTSASWWIDNREMDALKIISAVYNKREHEFDTIIDSIDSAPSDSAIAGETLSDEKNYNAERC